MLIKLAFSNEKNPLVHVGCLEGPWHCAWSLYITNIRWVFGNVLPNRQGFCFPRGQNENVFPLTNHHILYQNISAVQTLFCTTNLPAPVPVSDQGLELQSRCSVDRNIWKHCHLNQKKTFQFIPVVRGVLEFDSVFQPKLQTLLGTSSDNTAYLLHRAILL